MAETVRLLEPQALQRNPENPRLVFRQEELDALEASIAEQGILVPLTVYHDKSSYFLLDGERRWRCAVKLGLPKVPVIVQPRPDRMQNLMMMFAIHNARKDWDPLPTALKLEELEKEFKHRNGRAPTESELAGIASLSRGMVRRLKKLLGLPAEYRTELMMELEKPRSKQDITVDHVLEATKAAEQLKKRSVIDAEEEDKLRRALVEKFRSKVTTSTVDPRKLVRLARAVERKEVGKPAAKAVIDKLVQQKTYTIDEAFRTTVEKADFEHALEQLVGRVRERLIEHQRRKYRVSKGLATEIKELIALLQSIDLG